MKSSYEVIELYDNNPGTIRHINHTKVYNYRNLFCFVGFCLVGFCFVAVVVVIVVVVAVVVCFGFFFFKMMI